MPIAQTLVEAAQFVLETMFFAESEPVVEPVPLQADRLRFRSPSRATRSGRLFIGMPETCARAIAGSFEGLPDTANIPVAVVRQIAAELANMICGATLARLDRDGLSTLNSPTLLADLPPSPAESAALDSVSECWLQVPYMGDGLVHLALSLRDLS